MDEVDSYMLTTFDNPFNPHHQFDEWLAYDTTMGYHTSNYLARVVRSSDELSETDQILAIHQGIDEILEFDPLGIYRRIRENDEILLMD